MATDKKTGVTIDGKSYCLECARKEFANAEKKAPPAEAMIIGDTPENEKPVVKASLRQL